MDEKQIIAAEQAFEEWKKDKPVASLWKKDKLLDSLAKAVYLAATERTAQKCMEICNRGYENLGSSVAARAIAKEFGLD